MRLDAHQHFWIYNAQQYSWMTDALKRIRHHHLPPDLQPELAKAKLDGAIAVQARQSLEESRWLLELADQHPLVKGVVGWVDLRSEAVEEQLAHFAAHPKFVGVRHVVQDEPDDEFMLRPDFQRGIAKLKPFDLTYDILVFPKQLPAAIQLVEKFPEQPFVLDHIAKPLIKQGIITPWKQLIRTLASYPNVSCKLSGMVTEAKWDEWQPADFRPYLDVALETFGEDRSMFGSDWPVCRLAGSYERVYGLVNDYLQLLSEAARNKIFGENAAQFYGVI